MVPRPAVLVAVLLVSSFVLYGYASWTGVSGEANAQGLGTGSAPSANQTAPSLGISTISVPGTGRPVKVIAAHLVVGDFENGGNGTQFACAQSAGQSDSYVELESSLPTTLSVSYIELVGPQQNSSATHAGTIYHPLGRCSLPFGSTLFLDFPLYLEASTSPAPISGGGFIAHVVLYEPSDTFIEVDFAGLFG